MYNLHTIAAEDIEDLITDSVIAFFDNKELRVCFSASRMPSVGYDVSGTVTKSTTIHTSVGYHVLERGGATKSTVIHTYSDFESAVAKYNEL